MVTPSATLPTKNAAAPAAVPAEATAPSDAGTPKVEKVTVPAQAVIAPAAPLDCPPSAVQVTRSLPGRISEVEANGLRRKALGGILAATVDGRTAYVVDENERVVILDMPNARDQGHMFGRMIIFVERGGTPKTKIMTIPEVQKWLVETKGSIDTLTVGNNLRASELARFFNTARNQGEPLTEDEKQLYDWVLKWGMLHEEGSGVVVVEPERILITIPQASTVTGCAGCGVTAGQRATILEHEMSHAKWATDTVYQNYALWFWSNTLPLPTREKFTRFLRSRGYDPNNRELMANEMQAFLMHTPDPAMFSASALGVTDAELNDLKQAFQSGIAPKPLATAEKSYRID
jgi:hypothetical protein